MTGARQLRFRALPKTHIGSVDPDALKIPARRAECSLTKNVRSPFHAEPEHWPLLAFAGPLARQRENTYVTTPRNHCEFSCGSPGNARQVRKSRITHTHLRAIPTVKDVVMQVQQKHTSHRLARPR